MDRQVNEYARFKLAGISNGDDVFEPTSSNNAKQRGALVAWLNDTLRDLSLPINASDEELRAFLVDGSVLCRMLNKLKPGSVTEFGGHGSDNVQRFLSAMDKMGLPRFQAADLEKGSMKIVLECLLTLQTQFLPSVGNRNGISPREEPYQLTSPPFSEGDKRKLGSDSKFQRALRSSVRTEPSAALLNHVGHKFHEVFQLKQGSYTDIPASKISEMMKSNSLDNAPTQSLLSVVNGILDESIERKNGEIPLRVACLLRKVVQEIERRIATQADHLRTQSNLFKAREGKYQSRIRVLEALASGTGDETQSVMNQLEKIKNERIKIEAEKKTEEQEVARLMNEKEACKSEIAALKQELETEGKKKRNEEDSRLTKERGDFKQEVASLKQELEIYRRKLEENSSQMMLEATGSQKELESKLKEAVSQLAESRNRVKELEASSESKLKEVASQLTESRSRVKELEANSLSQLEESRSRMKELEAGSDSRLNEAISQLEESRNRMKELEALSAEKLKEAESQLTESRSRVKELEASSDSKLIEALSQLEESRNRMKELEALSAEKLKEAESQLTKSRSRVKELEASSDSKLIEALSQLEESRNRMKELEALSAEKLKEAESQLTKSRSRVKELEASSDSKLIEALSQLEESRNRMKELEALSEEKLKAAASQLTESRSRVKELEESSDSKLIEALSQLAESRNRAKELEASSESKLKEAASQITESRSRVKELEAISESKSQAWHEKEQKFHSLAAVQLGALRELRSSSESIRREVASTNESYSENFSNLGLKIRAMDDAVKNYHSLLSENRKIHNELQELKGNIRVYCRVRPFLRGQKQKQSTVEHIGENGEIVVSNPSKQAKESRRSFKFNKVYGPTSTQAEVFLDTQPLIQSVLDGYNVCILAYGQTGSGKTYTMTGPDGGTEEEWGVNYRALNDLFFISQHRKNSFTYEISVQMVEIYNEQVRDLLTSDGSQKSLSVLSNVPANGLAVPDASTHPVSSTSDVVKFMTTGLKNRARGATAMNERSSRSHSVVSIHVRGVELKSTSSLRSSLHLVDLAGSERVDRSEVTGDRLKEAQHINKSLSALGDVIFALAQKSPHVPYRNSKLTQVLQSSLGGQAKTLMFVQLNPDVGSATESISTLKFAERVSGVELGAAKSSKDVRDVRDLMEQVSSLKDTIAEKDEEIERLQLLKDPKNT